MAAALRSPRTQRAYAADWADFERWCGESGVRALPADAADVARYLDHVSGRRRATTVQRRVAAIRARHLDRAVATPTGAPSVRAAITRARWHDRQGPRVTPAIDVASLRAMSAAAPASPAGARDRAMLLLGYGGGLRPGELTALDVADVRAVRSGLRVRLARGTIVVPFGSDAHLCAVRAWRAWRRLVADGGPAFRPVDARGEVGVARLGEKAVTRIVRRCASRAGFDGAAWSGMSMRRGMVDAAAARGASARTIMDHTGHRSRRLVRGYMRDNMRDPGSPSSARTS